MGVRTVSQTIDLKNQLGAAATSKYITDISSTGITVHPSTVSQNIYYTQISDGFYIKQMAGSSIDTTNDTTLTSIKANDIIVGNSSGYNTHITNQGLFLRNANTDYLGLTTNEINLGTSNQTHTVIDPDSMTIYNSTNKLVDIDGGTTKGMTIYNGQGNSEQDIVASFLNNKFSYQEKGVPIFEIENSTQSPYVKENKFQNWTIDYDTEIITFVPNYCMTDFVSLDIEVRHGQTGAQSHQSEVSTIITLTPAAPQQTIYDSSNIISCECIPSENISEMGLMRITVTSSSRYLYIGHMTLTYLASTVGVSKIFCGAYPDKDEISLFTIGNGKDSRTPTNAFSVDWHGNVNTAGELYGPLTTNENVIIDIETHPTTGTNKSDVSAEIEYSSVQSFGRIVHAVFLLTVHGNWSAGGNIYGTISYADGFTPRSQADGTGFFGSGIVSCRLYSGNNSLIRFRNTTTINGSTDAQNIYCSVTWIR